MSTSECKLIWITKDGEAMARLCGLAVVELEFVTGIGT